MILDTSAIVATIAGEPDAAHFQNAMLGAGALAMSAVTALESRIVLYGRYGAKAVEAFEDLVAGARIEIVPFELANGGDRFRSLPSLRKRPGSPGAAQHRRLRRLCLGVDKGRTVAVQGKRLRQNGHSERDLTALRRDRHGVALQALIRPLTRPPPGLRPGAGSFPRGGRGRPSPRRASDRTPVIRRAMGRGKPRSGRVRVCGAIRSEFAMP